MDKEFAIEDDENLARLLKSAENGEDVILTKGGRPVGRIVPTSLDFDRAAARAAFDRIVERSRGVTLGPGLRLSDLAHEGHKY